MRTALRIAALFLALITLALWFFGGFNTGRTKISEVVRTAGTESRQETISKEVRFRPGLDFLATGGLLVAGVFATSFLFRSKPNS